MYEHRNWDVGSQKKKKKKDVMIINGLPIIPYIYIYEPPLLKDITFAALQGPKLTILCNLFFVK